MRRFTSAIGLSSMLLLTAQFAQAQPESPAVIARHQLSQCMTRRMSADRAISYNDALRTCKERLQAPKETLAANAPTGSVKSR